MRIRRLLILAAGLLFAASGTASAQDSGKAGITIAYPASIGFIWHATDTVAIRPAFSFSHNSAESASGSTESDGFAFGLDLGVLFYVKKYNNVRTYVSPRFRSSRSTSTGPTSSNTILPEVEDHDEHDGRRRDVRGAILAEQPLQRLRRSRAGATTTGMPRSTATPADRSVQVQYVGTTSGVGVISISEGRRAAGWRRRGHDSAPSSGYRRSVRSRTRGFPARPRSHARRAARPRSRLRCGSRARRSAPRCRARSARRSRVASRIDPAKQDLRDRLRPARTDLAVESLPPSPRLRRDRPVS